MSRLQKLYQGYFALCFVLLAGAAHPQDMEEQMTLALPPLQDAHDFAMNVLDRLQTRSFTERRELCGHFIYHENGKFEATPPIVGNQDSCTPPQLTLTSRAFASYHTHGPYNPDYDSEVPSIDDMKADLETGLDGYISTPEGRLWFISFDDSSAYVICGQSCMTADPQATNSSEDVPSHFTQRSLEAYHQDQ